jgi:signal transduction histidine kinase
MRLRIIFLTAATSSLVLVSFLLPLAIVLRTQAADRAISTATIQAQGMTPLVATLKPGGIRLAVDQMNAANSGAPITVFLPHGRKLGIAAPRSAAVRLAAKGRSFTTAMPAGVEILIAVEGLPAGTAVIRTFVPESQLRRGVTRAWLLLGLVGLGLLALSVAVADQLARSLVRPLVAVAAVSDRLAMGDLSARATLTGPAEVRRVGAGLNQLAARIGELLAHERETVADLSHRLRTPLTALRIDAESLHDAAGQAQLLDDVSAVECTVSKIIHDARRPASAGDDVACEAGMVVAERAAFWHPLAEDTERRMTVDVAPGQIPVRVSSEDLATCADILLENVFAHTPDGVGCAIMLSRREPGGALLVVADEGPGFPQADPTERGRSGIGSTGLGLDIARRIAESSGGTLTIGRSVSGGGVVTVGLGPPNGVADRRREGKALPGRQRGGRALPARQGGGRALPARQGGGRALPGRDRNPAGPPG